MQKSANFNEAQQAALNNAVKKAATDSDYRELCLTDPQKALREIGFANAKDFSIQFVDNAGADYTVVIPDLPELSNELSEEQLEAISGGSGIENTVCCEPPLTIVVEQETRSSVE